MDPFTEVQQDAEQQQKNIQSFLSKHSVISKDTEADFTNNMQELQETIKDLEDSIRQIEKNPDFFKISPVEISKRHQIVSKLNEEYHSLQSQWDSKANNTPSNPFKRYGEEDSDDKFDIDEESNVGFNEYQQQEILREQDQHLDGVYVSMQTINEQARAMGNELEEQAFIIDDLDQDIDRVGGKIQRGMKRVEYVIRKNQERASDCCIGLLIVALIVLLVMVIVA
ncbi:hypothetical protein WICMUC_001459 [Wickerhamomyces mucosus]|uniref:t-SNARE affecting a late Golgi compartment protein 1 n=1 Tax=Wickerhamomyces mucosus TaxID=1378264 RepID=A0A9P8PUL5_9ASCO|nr:hypothetical protein WICMUC_001459 [Wickerhamomyces mucosus]